MFDLPLEYLNLNDNHFSGEIPDAISKLTNAAFIGLSNNHFTGVLPAFKLIDKGICEVGGNDITCQSTGAPTCGTTTPILPCDKVDKVTPSDSQKTIGHESVPPWGIALIVIAGCLFLLLLGFVVWLNRRRKRAVQLRSNQLDYEGNPENTKHEIDISSPGITEEILSEKTPSSGIVTSDSYIAKPDAIEGGSRPEKSYEPEETPLTNKGINSLSPMRKSFMTDRFCQSEECSFNCPKHPTLSDQIISIGTDLPYRDDRSYPVKSEIEIHENYSPVLTPNPVLSKPPSFINNPYDGNHIETGKPSPKEPHIKRGSECLDENGNDENISRDSNGSELKSRESPLSRVISIISPSHSTLSTSSSTSSFKRIRTSGASYGDARSVLTAPPGLDRADNKLNRDSPNAINLTDGQDARNSSGRFILPDMEVGLEPPKFVSEPVPEPAEVFHPELDLILTDTDTLIGQPLDHEKLGKSLRKLKHNANLDIHHHFHEYDPNNPCPSPLDTIFHHILTRSHSTAPPMLSFRTTNGTVNRPKRRPKLPSVSNRQNRSRSNSPKSSLHSSFYNSRTRSSLNRTRLSQVFT